MPAVAPVAVSSQVPLVLTVHDLSFEHRPRDSTAYVRAWHRLAHPRRLARRAARLIAVSETVRREVVEEWDIEPEKVVTVPSGPGREPPEPHDHAPLGPDQAVDSAEAYVLAVGALEPRKRPDLLIDAHARARRAGLRAGLVLAGGGRLRDGLNRPDVRVLGHVPDDRLDRLYRDALALVCVSREEGFAFTPLEALARGTPAVVSDLPVFAETLGEGALRIPPDDPGALARALLQIERDEKLRARLVQAGREAVSELSWARAARQTRAVLHEAARAGAGV